MNRYEEYKKVNLIWLKEIPSHWEIIPISHVFEERRERNNNGNNQFILSVMKNIGVIPYTDKGNVGNKASENIENYKVVYPNDLVLNSMNMMIGSLGKSNYKGVLSQVYYVLKLMNSSKYNIDYLNYLFKNKVFHESFRVLGKGILDHRLRVPIQLLKYEKIIIPPINEQEQIANYLDWKINEIDRLIKIEKEKQILVKNVFNNELKRKYISLRKYNMVSLKRICTIFSGKEVVDEIHFKKGAIPVYGSGNIVFKYTSNVMLDGKFIIFGRKGTIGKPYIVNSKFWLVDTAYAAVNNDLVTFDYLFYLLRILNWEEFTTNTVKPSIVANQVIQTKIKLPVIEEQNAITSDINIYEKNVNTILEFISKKIKELESLKQSLISEVVTGKIDVRNVVIPEYEKVTVLDDTAEEFDEMEGIEDGD
ncbi:restriction endonuclease subunit S [Mesomycoplasma ovipneumoniae]